jgi:ribose transport system substrate-binding protein
MASTLSRRSRRAETTAAGDHCRPRSASNRPWRPERRDLIRLAAASMGASLTGGFPAAAVAAPSGQSIRRSQKPLRAAFSNIGLQVTWCTQGKQAAEFWGKLFNVDITWFDGGLSVTRQRAALEEIASRDWDFVAIQAVEIDTLAAPVNRLIEAGIPVIDMDTLIAPLDQIAVHTFLAPDNEFMGAVVTQALAEAIDGTGTIIMTQGALGHTGAQGRARGFQSVIARYPNIEVLSTEPADWDAAKAAQLWESYLSTYSHIDAAFFHNDDMALAAVEVMKARNRTDIRVGGVDAMPPAIHAVLGWPHARDRAELLLPHSWGRDRRARGGRACPEEGACGPAKADSHRRTGRHPGECTGPVVDARSLSDLNPVLACVVTEPLMWGRASALPNRTHVGQGVSLQSKYACGAGLQPCKPYARAGLNRATYSLSSRRAAPRTNRRSGPVTSRRSSTRTGRGRPAAEPGVPNHDCSVSTGASRSSSIMPTRWTHPIVQYGAHDLTVEYSRARSSTE